MNANRLTVNRYTFSRQETAELEEAFGTRNSALIAAIAQATNRARLYIVPCTWTAKYYRGQIIVTRTHNRTEAGHV